MDCRWAVVASFIVALPATAMANIVGPEESAADRLLTGCEGAGPYAMTVLGLILLIVITLNRVGGDEDNRAGNDGDVMNDDAGESRPRQ